MAHVWGGGGRWWPEAWSLLFVSDFSAVRAAEAKLPGSWRHFMNHCESRGGGRVGKGHWKGEPWPLEKEKSLSRAPHQKQGGGLLESPSLQPEITEGGSLPRPVISTKQPLPGHPFYFACSPGTSKSPWPILLGESRKGCSC